MMSKSSMILIVAFIFMPLMAEAVTTDVSGFPLAAIILTPLIFGFMLLLGAFVLDPEEHAVLRIGLVLISFLTYFLSAWWGVIVVVNHYAMTELEEAITLSVWVVGGVIFVILSYFIIYAFYKAVHTAAQKKEEMMLQ